MLRGPLHLPPVASASLRGPRFERNRQRPWVAAALLSRALLGTMLIGTVLVGTVLGCEPQGGAATPPAPEPTALNARAYVPTTVGDRWRERVGEASRTVGVTGQTPSGLLVTFGTHDRRPSFYRVDDEGVTLVRPDGTTLEPLLRGAMQEGASFRYTSGEGPLAAPCTVEVTESSVVYPVGDVADCVALTRTCRHPEGGLFRAPTIRRSTETWCPGLGRVRSAMELDPPIEGATAPPTTETVHFVTSQGRAGAGDFDCSRMLLLESDVAAACGPGWGLQSETPGTQACTTRFVRGDDAIELRVSRRQSERAARIAEARSISATAEGTVTRASTEGRHSLVVSGTSGCEADRLERLLPLLASMVRVP